ncbi:hypothetical protein BJ508DRAFT_410392 [Ascobolus immersus RN42]|uniref:Uncharacterized protein n=1 Tax=Ascobolus immersus RN42 TaxID=1160509 RepID=A0A3N4INA9_ASCIM|nr:hypothetical protein BJ508DRAFT_410392 [Ascobolus immersus RN42]
MDSSIASAPSAPAATALADHHVPNSESLSAELQAAPVTNSSSATKRSLEEDDTLEEPEPKRPALESVQGGVEAEIQPSAVDQVAEAVATEATSNEVIPNESTSIDATLVAAAQSEESAVDVTMAETTPAETTTTSTEATPAHDTQIEEDPIEANPTEAASPMPDLTDEDSDTEESPHHFLGLQQAPAITIPFVPPVILHAPPTYDPLVETRRLVTYNSNKYLFDPIHRTLAPLHITKVPSFLHKRIYTVKVRHNYDPDAAGLKPLQLCKTEDFKVLRTHFLGEQAARAYWTQQVRFARLANWQRKSDDFMDGYYERYKDDGENPRAEVELRRWMERMEEDMREGKVEEEVDPISGLPVAVVRLRPAPRSTKEYITVVSIERDTYDVVVKDDTNVGGHQVQVLSKMEISDLNMDRWDKWNAECGNRFTDKLARRRIWMEEFEQRRQNERAAAAAAAVAAESE